jgi:acetoin utilization deacetylase AcuC-like enzyme
MLRLSLFNVLDFICFWPYGEGFCVFNDIAVSAVAALKHYPDALAASKTPILIIDLDVHQGNGGDGGT